MPPPVDQITPDEAAALLGQSSTASGGTFPPPPPNAIQVSRAADGSLVGPGGQTFTSGGVDTKGVRHDVIDPEEAKALLAGGPVDPWSDIAGGAATGAISGAAGSVGWLGDLQGLVDRAAGVDPGKTWAQQGLANPTKPAGGWLADLERQIINAGQIEAGSPQLASDRPTPIGFSSRSILDPIEQLIGPLYRPQTLPGRAAETVASLLPAGAFPGSAEARAMRVLTPALGSEAAGETARAGAPDNPDAETWARVLGGVAGGGVQAIGEGAVNRPFALAGQAAENLTPDQLSMASALRQNAAAQGIDLSIPEAVQQVTGGGTQLGRLQRFMESARPTSGQWSAFMARRPGQVAGAVQDFTGSIGDGETVQPGVLAARSQRAGSGAIDQAVGQVRSAADQAGYTAADQQDVDPELMSALLARVHGQIAGDQTGLIAPKLAQLRDNLTLQPATPPAEAPAPAPALGEPPAIDPAGLQQVLEEIRTYGTGRTGDLLTAVRNLGGVRTLDSSGNRYTVGPDLQPLQSVRIGAINNQGGMPPEDMAQALADRGWFDHAGDASQAFEAAWNKQAGGDRVFHPQAYEPGFADRAASLEDEMQAAGVGANDTPTQAAQKLYEMRHADELERQAVQWEGNLGDPDLAEFDRLAAPTPDEGKPAVPVTNIGQLSTARNHWLDVLDNSPPDRLSNYQSGILRGNLDELESALMQNPDYAAGKSAYAQGQRSLVEPLQSGPVGTIAAQGGLGAKTGALFPQNPFPGQPDATAGAVGALNGQDEGLAEALTRAHLEQQFGQATRNLTSGANQYGGALFARNVQGNPIQADTLHAAFNAFDPSGSTSGRFSDLVDALEATGRRERPGSLTAFNQEDRDALSMAPPLAKFAGTALDPLEWGPALTKFIGRKGYESNLQTLSDLLLDPNTEAALARARAAAGGPSAVPALVAPATQLQRPN